MPTTHRAVVVLYDPVTGIIIHGHYFEADSSDELPTKEALEKRRSKRRDATSGRVLTRPMLTSCTSTRSRSR